LGVTDLDTPIRTPEVLEKLNMSCKRLGTFSAKVSSHPLVVLPSFVGLIIPG
jgi:hypothetical protein